VVKYWPESIAVVSLQIDQRNAKTNPCNHQANRSMQPCDPEILYEDNHLLAINKPSGLPTQGALPGRPNLLQWGKQYIKSQYGKPGNVYLGVVSRLDSPVSGVVVLARTSKAAARLTSHIASGATHKTYWAVVSCKPQPAAGECVDWIAHDDANQRMVVASEHTPAAKRARLEYQTLRPVSTGWLVEVRLDTGRKHQIRLQLAARGWPVAGDRKYGSTSPWPAGIALHARQLELVHPVKKTRVSLIAPLPESWREMGIQG
jgi:23S rRNA pseudouridine1911/1915/1917 synthase